MTEAEWLACADPRPMLKFLGRKADPRKLRLFAVACARRQYHLLDDERSRQALNLAERYADRGKKGPPSRKELQQAELAAWAAGHALMNACSAANAAPDYSRYNAAAAATEAVAPFACGAAQLGAERAAHAVFAAQGPRRAKESAARAGRLRCIFGNPAYPITRHRTWLTPAVRSLAAAAYCERTLPAGTLDIGSRRRSKEGRVGSWTSLPWQQFGPAFATSLAVQMLRPQERRGPLPALPGRELTAKEVEALWADLAGPDVFRAADAARRLGGAPAQAVPFLARQLRPAKVDSEQMARLVADLESPRFAARQKAEDELERLGELAEPALNEALARKPALDLRTRLERLLGRLQVPAASLRPTRAARVLELANTPEASELLAKQAQGAAGAHGTRAAVDALKRLEKMKQ